MASNNQAAFGNETIGRIFNKLGLEKLPADNSIWISKDKQIIVGLYIDDIVLTAKNMVLINKIKMGLGEAYEIEDKGPIGTILGIQVIRDRQNRTISPLQGHYIEDISIGTESRQRPPPQCIKRPI